MVILVPVISFTMNHWSGSCRVCWTCSSTAGSIFSFGLTWWFISKIHMGMILCLNKNLESLSCMNSGSCNWQSLCFIICTILSTRPDFHSPLPLSFRLTHKSIDKWINSQNKPFTKLLNYICIWNNKLALIVKLSIHSYIHTFTVESIVPSSICLTFSYSRWTVWPQAYQIVTIFACNLQKVNRLIIYLLYIMNIISILRREKWLTSSYSNNRNTLILST